VRARSSWPQALGAKLAAASNQLDRENSTAVANVLRAFVQQIEALVKSGKLAAAQGEELMDAAEIALGFIQGNATPWTRTR